MLHGGIDEIQECNDRNKYKWVDRENGAEVVAKEGKTRM